MGRPGEQEHRTGWGGRRRGVEGGPRGRRAGPCGQRCPLQPQAQSAVGKLWTGSAENLGEERHRGRSDRKRGSSASPSKEEGPKGGPAGTVWGLGAGGAGEAQKPGGHHAGVGPPPSTVRAQRAPSRPAHRATAGDVCGDPGGGVLPAGLRCTLGCFPEPDGLWVCAPTPAPQAAARG